MLYACCDQPTCNIESPAAYKFVNSCIWGVKIEINILRILFIYAMNMLKFKDILLKHFCNILFFSSFYYLLLEDNYFFFVFETAESVH